MNDTLWRFGMDFPVATVFSSWLPNLSGTAVFLKLAHRIGIKPELPNSVGEEYAVCLVTWTCGYSPVEGGHPSRLWQEQGKFLSIPALRNSHDPGFHFGHIEDERTRSSTEEDCNFDSEGGTAR
ncbi:uncharacterized protein LOC144582301 isoform X2 [Callithrix jacchus]